PQTAHEGPHRQRLEKGGGRLVAGDLAVRDEVRHGDADERTQDAGAVPEQIPTEEEGHRAGPGSEAGDEDARDGEALAEERPESHEVLGERGVRPAEPPGLLSEVERQPGAKEVSALGPEHRLVAR